MEYPKGHINDSAFSFAPNRWHFSKTDKEKGIALWNHRCPTANLSITQYDYISLSCSCPTVLGIWVKAYKEQVPTSSLTKYSSAVPQCRAATDLRSTKDVNSIRNLLRRLPSSAHIRTTPIPVCSITSFATVLQNLAFRFSMELLPSYTATKFLLHSLECSIW